jgi:hypothetical protein
MEVGGIEGNTESLFTLQRAVELPEPLGIERNVDDRFGVLEGGKALLGHDDGAGEPTASQTITLPRGAEVPEGDASKTIPSCSRIGNMGLGIFPNPKSR